MKPTNKLHSKKAQSTVEYIILFAAIIGLVLVFFQPGGYFRRAWGSTFTQTTNGMEDMSRRISISRDQPPIVTGLAGPPGP